MLGTVCYFKNSIKKQIFHERAHVRSGSLMILWEVPWRRLTISIFDVMMSSTVSKNCGKVILSVGSSLSISFRSSFILARNDLRVAESTCTCMVQLSHAGINTGLSIAGPSGAGGGGGKLDLFNNYLFSTIIQVCFRKFREEKKNQPQGWESPVLHIL